MSNLLIRTLLSAIAVVVLANVLDGVYVDSYLTAIIVAVVLAVLNLFVRPILILLTLPVTVITLGIFLLFINAFIILMANSLVPGFSVDGVWSAIVFSILLAISESLLFALFKAEEK
jgi:putative membrane protein